MKSARASSPPKKGSGSQGKNSVRTLVCIMLVTPIQPGRCGRALSRSKARTLRGALAVYHSNFNSNTVEMPKLTYHHSVVDLFESAALCSKALASCQKDWTARKIHHRNAWNSHSSIWVEMVVLNFTICVDPAFLFPGGDGDGTHNLCPHTLDMKRGPHRTTQLLCQQKMPV